MIVCLTDISRSSLYTKFLQRNSIVAHFSICLSEYETDIGKTTTYKGNNEIDQETGLLGQIRTNNPYPYCTPTPPKQKKQNHHTQ
jgi:hypothetical protein